MMKIPAPNYTQVPNEMLDNWLPLLGEGELKVLLVVIRKTFGWHRAFEGDQISLTQFEKHTGMKRTNIIVAIKSLISKGIIEKAISGPVGKQEVYYKLVIIEEPGHKMSKPETKEGGSCCGTPTSPAAGRGGVPQRDPQKKALKETSNDDDVRARESERENEKMQTSDDVKSPTTEPVRKPGKKYSIHLIDGGIMQISADDVYTVAVQRNKDWTADEIENALVSIENSCKKVRDWVRYLEGVIETSRLQNKTPSKRNNPCKQKTLKQESANPKSETSAQGTKRLVSLAACWTPRRPKDCEAS